MELNRNIQAAVFDVKFRYLPKLIVHRWRTAERYFTLLRGVGELVLLSFDGDGDPIAFKTMQFGGRIESPYVSTF